MAGRGQAPKDPARRARRNADPIPQRVVPLVREGAPELPADYDWHPRTQAWWTVWQDSPLSDDFTGADWEFLLETAFIHSSFWGGDLKQAAELRLRVAKFGATPEDRARLRIVFADADEKDHKAGNRKPSGQPTSGAYGGLRAVGGSTVPADDA